MRDIQPPCCERPGADVPWVLSLDQHNHGRVVQVRDGLRHGDFCRALCSVVTGCSFPPLILPCILLHLLLPWPGQGIRQQQGCARTRSLSHASCQAELEPTARNGTDAEFHCCSSLVPANAMVCYVRGCSCLCVLAKSLCAQSRGFRGARSVPCQSWLLGRGIRRVPMRAPGWERYCSLCAGVSTSVRALRVWSGRSDTPGEPEDASSPPRGASHG